VGLRPLAFWDCGFESCRGHGYLSLVSVVCCQADEEVKSAVRKWFQKQNTIFFKGGFKKLVQRWRKCIEVRGYFVEK
jgi:spore coat polysaccharide biosynthesis protein SpsF (cytidylyltransferase family)